MAFSVSIPVILTMVESLLATNLGIILALVGATTVSDCRDSRSSRDQKGGHAG